MTSNLHQNDLDYKDFFSYHTMQEKLLFLTKIAEKAPSRFNTRPWNFKVYNEQICVYTDMSKRLDLIDPYCRELYISMGCLLANLEIAAEYYGMKYSTSILTGEPSHNLLFVMNFPPTELPKTVYPSSLFHTIFKRHVAHGSFVDRPIEAKDIERLQESIDWIEEVSLFMTSDFHVKDYLANITLDSELEQFSNIAFRREQARWIKNNEKPTGMPISAMHLSPVKELLVSIYKDFNFGPDKAVFDKKLIDSADYIGILSTKRDGIIDWISTGIAFQVMSLRAVELGISFQPITSSIEVPYFRRKVQDLIESTQTPQMLIRFGYESKTPPSTTI
ncbi:MAG: hypothetical protein M3Q44_04620 [bacterium]|nr:hypothetical protein [bacterium]